MRSELARQGGGSENQDVKAFREPGGFRAVEQTGDFPGVQCVEAKQQAEGQLAGEAEGGRY